MIVSETDCSRAAQRIRLRMRVNGGAWVIQAHDDGTFEMVPNGEARAERILRSGSPCVAGTFTADVDVLDLREALSMAKRGETAHKRRKMTAAERAWHTKYKRGWRDRRRAAGAAA